MFSLAKIPVRKYEFENPDNGAVLHVLPPKLETLEMFNRVFSSTASSPKEMAAMVATIISNNDEQAKIELATVMRWMDVDQLAAFVADFLGWMNNTKENDPN